MQVNWQYIIVASVVGAVVGYFVTKTLDRAIFQKELRALGH